jgi:hypothetical protein
LAERAAAQASRSNASRQTVWDYSNDPRAVALLQLVLKHTVALLLQKKLAARPGPLYSLNIMTASPDKSPSVRSKSDRKSWLVSIAVCLSLIAGVFWWRVVYLPNRDRAAWKNAIMPQLANLSVSDDSIRKQLEFLKSDAAQSTAVSWSSEQILLMTNGQYLIYAYRHGNAHELPAHLFLARGSDDRWYYSSYHFCRNMLMLSGDEPPGSIAEFAHWYGVRQFDGKSDDCQKKTKWQLR